MAGGPERSKMKRTKGMPVRIGRWFYARGRAPGGARRILGDSRAGFLHSNKGGKAVLRGESSWRTVSGLYINAFGGFVTIQFRRFVR